jgi:uncharacterized protein
MFGLTSRGRPAFDIRSDGVSAETLVVGFSEFGLAGLAAVDYLVTHLDLEQIGHIRVEQLPAITPFADGRPRNHTRLYSRPDLDFTVLVGELFVPAAAADEFGSAILEWTEEAGVEEVVVLSGVPVAHGPEAHRTYYIATDEYRERHFESEEDARTEAGAEGETGTGTGADTDAETDLDADADTDTDPDTAPAPDPVPMGGGYLDGINGALVGHAMHSDLEACVLTTPVHAQAPDAALRLLTTLDSVYGLGVDLGPMEAFAERAKRQYEELAARMRAAQSEAGEAMPEDRMYM